MPIHINLVCDHGPHDGAAQPVGFDHLSETFGDLVAAARGAGWLIDLPDKLSGPFEAKAGRVLCPDCAKDPKARAKPRPDAGDSILVKVTLRKYVGERLRGMCHARGETASVLVDRWIFQHDDQGNPRPEVVPKTPRQKISDALGVDVDDLLNRGRR